MCSQILHISLCVHVTVLENIDCTHVVLLHIQFTYDFVSSDCLVSWSELASKLNRRDDSCRKRFLLVASKEQKLRMKTLRVKQNKAVRKKYVKKVDKTKLIPAVSTYFS